MNITPGTRDYASANVCYLNNVDLNHPTNHPYQSPLNLTFPSPLFSLPKASLRFHRGDTRGINEFTKIPRIFGHFLPIPNQYIKRFIERFKKQTNNLKEMGYFKSLFLFVQTICLPTYLNM